MSEKYTRMEHRNVSGLISDVLKTVGDKPAFIELHNLVEMLDINLTDKYFREAFNYKPTDGIATLIQYDAIHLYDFSKLLDKADRKTENGSEKPNNCEAQIVDWGKRKPCTLELFDDDGNYIEPKTEPQTSGVLWTEDAIKNEPKSYTTWASTDEPQTERECE